MPSRQPPSRRLAVHPQWSLPEDELEWQFARSGGPGGQNVNKVNSKVELRWNLDQSRSVPELFRERIRARAGSALISSGEILLTSTASRSQLANREDVLARLLALLKQCLKEPRRRKATKPGKGAVERRLETKKKQQSKKADRRKGRRVSED